MYIGNLCSSRNTTVLIKSEHFTNTNKSNVRTIATVASIDFWTSGIANEIGCKNDIVWEVNYQDATILTHLQDAWKYSFTANRKVEAEYISQKNDILNIFLSNHNHKSFLYESHRLMCFPIVITYVYNCLCCYCLTYNDKMSIRYLLIKIYMFLFSLFFASLLGVWRLGSSTNLICGESLSRPSV